LITWKRNRDHRENVETEKKAPALIPSKSYQRQDSEQRLS
jgi:hypothetical protein